MSQEKYSSALPVPFVESQTRFGLRSTAGCAFVIFQSQETKMKAGFGVCSWMCLVFYFILFYLYKSFLDLFGCFFFACCFDAFA